MSTFYYHQRELERTPSGVFFAVDEVPRGGVAYPHLEDVDGGVAHHVSRDATTDLTRIFPRFPRVHSAKTWGQRPVLCLPLLDVSAEVQVDCTIATTNLTQRFTNISAAAIPEVHYTFPLYNGSIVTSFRCHIGDSRVLEGHVKPKTTARQEYKRAIEKMETAALLEEFTPDIFETLIGNIPPKTTVKIDITYVHDLKGEPGGTGVIVTIPTSIAPRYGQHPMATHQNQMHLNLV